MIGKINIPQGAKSYILNEHQIETLKEHLIIANENYDKLEICNRHEKNSQHEFWGLFLLLIVLIVKDWARK